MGFRIARSSTAALVLWLVATSATLANEGRWRALIENEFAGKTIIDGQEYKCPTACDCALNGMVHLSDSNGFTTRCAPDIGPPQFQYPKPAYCFEMLRSIMNKRGRQ